MNSLSNYIYAEDLSPAPVDKSNIDKKLLKLLDKPGDENIAEVYDMINKGADVNATEPDTRTALMKAAFFGRVKAAKILIEKGALVNAIDQDGNTVLVISSINQFPPQLEVMRLLIDNGALINKTNDYGWTALMEAAKGQPPQMIKKFIEINRKDLVTASTKMVKLLLENGAKIDVQDENGLTALMMAVSNNHLETIKVLLKNGVDKSIKDKNNRTALIIAEQRGYKKAVELLK